MQHKEEVTACAVERETRVELATSTLARLRSTTELFPHTVFERDTKLDVIPISCKYFFQNIEINLLRHFSFNSSISMVLPSSKDMEVTDLSGIPQGMIILNIERSLLTFKANP